MALYKYQNNVQDAVFERVKEHFENFVIEMSENALETFKEHYERVVIGMTENAYNDAIDDIKHEEINCEISSTYKGEVNEVLCDYGIDNAIKLYHDVHVDLNEVTSCALLYTILTETTKLSYDDYITWLKKNK
jgi:predicted Zn-dependent protease with MMP-like domain